MVRNRTMPYVTPGASEIRPAIDYENHPVFRARPRWRRELHRIIFGHLTPGGKLFDVVLIITILMSVAVVMLESVTSVRARHGPTLRTAEWVITIAFTVEYALRLASAERARRYARSFFGVIDLLAILPTYVSLVVPGGQALAVIRILRVLRVFRVLKLAQFVGGEQLLLRALRASAYKIVVFLVAVLTIVVAVGAMMYVIEGPDSGFTSIPAGVYWAVVTLTTVGFGDITPVTALGQMLAAFLMVLGYGIIAVPTGIVTVEMMDRRGRSVAPGVGSAEPPPAAGDSGRSEPPDSPAGQTRPPSPPVRCPHCGADGHPSDARFCRLCAAQLPLD